MLAVDLDGTLVRVNSFPYFVRFLLRQLLRQRRLADAWRVARALIARKALRGSHVRLKATVYDASAAVDAAACEDWARAFLARFLNPEVEALVRAWPATRVLCTSAPETYAAAIGRALDFHVTLGSYAAAGGFVENAGAQKIVRLREAELVPLDTAITDDDRLDGPLLASASHRLLVVDGRLVGR